MIATNVRRLGVYLMLAFAVVSGSIVWWQVVEADSLATRSDNPEVIAARRSLPRGTIFDSEGQLLASSEVIDGLSRRTYADPAFTHVIGYSSLRFGSTGLERAFEDILVGQTDPNPIRELVSDVLARQPQPRDLTLTIDRRLQDFAAAQLGAAIGAVVALDPQTGEILAMVSTPTFDATPISGDPEVAQEPMDALRNDPAEPLLPRDRQGLYVPGSIMKVFTAAAALDAGAITPETTFPDQPRAGARGLRRERLHDPRARPRRHRAGALAALGGAPGVEQHLLRPRRAGARRGALPRVRAPLRLLRAGRHRPVRSCAAGGHQLRERAGGRRLRAVRRRRRARQRVVRAGTDGGHPGADGARGCRDRRRRRHARTRTSCATSERTPRTAPRATRSSRRFGSGGGTRVVSSEAAAATRAAMVDAVNGELGRLYAGQGDVTLYGISNARSAGKTGTAQLGGEQAPHSWFIGFAPAQDDATPQIAIAVLVASGGSGSDRAAPIAGRVMAEWLRLSGGE